MTADFESLIASVLAWGEARGLHDTKDPTGQFIKLAEELGELSAGIARNNEEQTIDALGDMLVVMINLGAVIANQYATSPEHPYDQKDVLSYALRTAWQQIEHRTGRLENNVFIKDDG